MHREVLQHKANAQVRIHCCPALVRRASITHDVMAGRRQCNDRTADAVGLRSWLKPGALAVTKSAGRCRTRRKSKRVTRIGTFQAPVQPAIKSASTRPPAALLARESVAARDSSTSDRVRPHRPCGRPNAGTLRRWPCDAAVGAGDKSTPVFCGHEMPREKWMSCRLQWHCVS